MVNIKKHHLIVVLFLFTTIKEYLTVKNPKQPKKTHSVIFKPKVTQNKPIV